MRIRPFRPTDTEALVDVCVRTADLGGDATGQLPDDRLWAQIYLLPYLERHPDLAFVIELHDDGHGTSPVEPPAGYIVAADDTAQFAEWFATEWWPSLGLPAPEQVPDGLERDLLARGWNGVSPWTPDGAPAHLHIDLLPSAQGRGGGRALMESLCTELAQRGIGGVHATAGTANLGARAFYPRVGFAALPATGGAQTFVRRLSSSPAQPRS